MIKSHVLYRLSYGLVAAPCESARNLVVTRRGVNSGRPRLTLPSPWPDNGAFASQTEPALVRDARPIDPLRRDPFVAVIVALLTAALLAIIAPLPVFAAPPARPADFTDNQIARGFMLTVFGREGPASSQAAGHYVNKFIDPVGVYVLDASGVAGRRAEVAGFVALLDRIVPNLKIRMAEKPEKARLFVFLVNRSNYRKVIADALPRGAEATFMERSRCSAVMWNRTTGVLDRAYVFILADRGQKTFTSCLAEELTQALGPANDSSKLPYSLYNDDNDVGTFGLFDWYILATLYDDAMMPGMNADEALSVLPGAIARARTFASRVRPFLGED